MGLDQVRAQLVHEVGPLVGHTLVHAGHPGACLRLVAAAPLPAAVGALGATELARTTAVEARGWDWRSITGHHGVLEPQVQAQVLRRSGEGQPDRRHLRRGYQADVPVPTGVLLARGALG